MLELIEENKRYKIAPSDIFSVVREGPGLYYEWLNFVISLGGYDVLLSDGHLDGVGFVRPETKNATRRFVDLARQTRYSKTMDDQIVRFAKRRCALYMGWTDSFRFERSSEDGSLTEVRPTRLAGKSPSSRAHLPLVRLAAGPRDMRQQRTCLVDGWLMTFPRRAGERDPSAAGLDFAKWFLESSRQQHLLRRGFPSPSSWAVEREIEAFQAEHARPSGGTDGAPDSRLHVEASYDVFLTTMQTAIWGGRWAASPQARVDTLVTEALSQLISDPKKDVEAALVTLQNKVIEELKESED